MVLEVRRVTSANALPSTTDNDKQTTPQPALAFVLLTRTFGRRVVV